MKPVDEGQSALPRPVRLWLAGVALASLAIHAPLAVFFWSTLPAVDAPHTWISDFSLLWAAARLAWLGQAAAAYDGAGLALLLPAQPAGAAPLLPFFYPPPFLLLFAPLGALPHNVAYLVFIALSFTALLAALVWAFRGQRGWAAALALALAFGGNCALLYFGQNTTLWTALYLLALGGIRCCPRLAGVALGLACWKPQFGLLVPPVLLLGRSYQTFLGAALVTLGLCLLSAGVFGAEVWSAYLQAALAPLHRLTGFALPNPGAALSLYGTLRHAGAGALPAWLAQGFLILAAGVLMGRIMRRSPAAELPLALIPLATLVMLPLVFIYDTVLLLPPLLYLGLRGFLARGGWLDRGVWTALYLGSGSFHVLHHYGAVGLFPLLGLILLWRVDRQLATRPGP